MESNEINNQEANQNMKIEMTILDLQKQIQNPSNWYNYQKLFQLHQQKSELYTILGKESAAKHELQMVEDCKSLIQEPLSVEKLKKVATNIGINNFSLYKQGYGEKMIEYTQQNNVNVDRFQEKATKEESKNNITSKSL